MNHSGSTLIFSCILDYLFVHLPPIDSLSSRLLSIDSSCRSFRGESLKVRESRVFFCCVFCVRKCLSPCTLASNRVLLRNGFTNKVARQKAKQGFTASASNLTRSDKKGVFFDDHFIFGLFYSVKSTRNSSLFQQSFMTREGNV